MDYKKVRFNDTQQADKMLSGKKDSVIFNETALDYSKCEVDPR